MGLEVACKVMQLDMVADQVVVGVLLQGVESSIVAELSHPNIIRTFQIYHVRHSGRGLESSIAESTEEENVGLVADRVSDSNADSFLIRDGRGKGVEQLWIVQELCRAGDLGRAIHDKVGVE